MARNSLLGLNTGTGRAATSTGSPVRGLRAIRVLRCRILNVPKPRTSMLCCSASAAFTASRNESTTRAQSFLEIRGPAGRKHLSGCKIPHRMVPASMAVGQLHRVAAQREPEQLVAETDAEDRQRAVGKLAQRVDGIADGRRVAGAVRKEQAVGLELAHLRRARLRRHD